MSTFKLRFENVPLTVTDETILLIVKSFFKDNQIPYKDLLVNDVVTVCNKNRVFKQTDVSFQLRKKDYDTMPDVSDFKIGTSTVVIKKLKLKKKPDSRLPPIGTTSSADIQSYELDPFKYPIGLVWQNDVTRNDLVDLLKSKHNATISQNLSGTFTIERPAAAAAISNDHQRTWPDSLVIDLMEFEQARLEVYKINQKDVHDEQTWRKVEALAEEKKAQSESCFVEVKKTSPTCTSISFKLLPSEFDRVRAEIRQIISNEERRLSEIAIKTSWQIKYLRKKEADLSREFHNEIEESLELHLLTNKVVFVGRSVDCERAKQKFAAFLLSISKFDLPLGDLNIKEFLTSNETNLEKLNQMSKMKSLDLVVVRSSETAVALSSIGLNMVATNDSLLADCQRLIEQIYLSIRIKVEADFDLQNLELYLIKLLNERRHQGWEYDVIYKIEEANLKDRCLYLTGLKYLIGILSKEMLDYLDVKKMTKKELSGEFTYEDFRFLRVVTFHEVDTFSRERDRELQRKTLELFEDDTDYCIRVTANKICLEKYTRFFKSLLNSKISENYETSSEQLFEEDELDLFDEEAILEKINEIELKCNCLIRPSEEELEGNDGAGRADQAETEADEDENCQLICVSSDWGQSQLAEQYKIGENQPIERVDDVIFEFLDRTESTGEKTFILNLTSIDSDQNDLLAALVNSCTRYLMFNGKNVIKTIYFIHDRLEILNEIIEKAIESARFSKIEIKYGSIADDVVSADVVVDLCDKQVLLEKRENQTSNQPAQKEDLLKSNRLKRQSNDDIIVIVAEPAPAALRNKRFIYHVCLNKWNSADESASKQHYRKVIFDLLTLADDNGLRSVAFPVLGGEDLAYPGETVPKLMHLYVTEYLSCRASLTNLETVYFVVSPGESEQIASSFRRIQFTNKKLNKKAMNRMRGRQINNKARYLTEYGIRYGNVKFKIYLGDILKSETDLILSPSDASLTMAGEVASRLVQVDAQLSSQIQELRASAATFSRQFALTQANSTLFNFGHIVHMDTTCKLEDVLVQLDNQGYKSITIPLIGSGAAQRVPVRCFESINHSVALFGNKAVNLRDVRLCLLKQEYLNDVIGMLKLDRTLIKIDQVEGDKKSGNHLLKPVPISIPSDADADDLDKPTVAISKSFRLISNKMENIEKCRGFLNDMIEKQIHSIVIEKENLKELDDATKESIKILCLEKGVLFSLNFEQNRIKLTGAEDVVMKIRVEILDSLNNYLEKKCSEIKAVIVSEHVQWEYEDSSSNNSGGGGGGQFLPFNMFLNFRLETMYRQIRKNSTTEEDEATLPKEMEGAQEEEDDEQKQQLENENGEIFLANLENKTYKLKNASGDQRGVYKLRRNDKKEDSIKLPDEWMPEKDLHLIDLSPESEEFERVKALALDRGLNGLLTSVVSIQRVQNRILYLQYKLLREKFRTNYPSEEVEKTVFHGTFEDSFKSIYETGFNRSYCGRNATLYGKGVYFARDSSYSHSYTGRGGPYRRMFIAKVLVKEMEHGNSEMNHPSVDMGVTVDNPQDPSIFVIYKDAQAYPEYLLTYN